MSNIWLTVEIAPGSDIGKTCDEAIALAGKLEVTVWFDFNGVRCLARKGDDPRGLENDWREQIISKHDYKIASDKKTAPNAGAVRRGAAGGTSA